MDLSVITTDLSVITTDVNITLGNQIDELSENVVITKEVNKTWTQGK